MSLGNIEILPEEKNQEPQETVIQKIETFKNYKYCEDGTIPPVYRSNY